MARTPAQMDDQPYEPHEPGSDDNVEGGGEKTMSGQSLLTKLVVTSAVYITESSANCTQ
jgi:hypothetical protein